jgi:hypothetical protein
MDSRRQFLTAAAGFAAGATITDAVADAAPLSGTTSVQMRAGTAAQAAQANPVLRVGEIGFETDTGKFKLGDGHTAWNDLDYATDLSRLPVAVQDGILIAYEPGANYRAGDQVVIDNLLYTANQRIALAPESPDLTHWTTVGGMEVDASDPPAPPTVLGSPGTDRGRAASRNHSHPLGALGRAMAFGGALAPSYGANSDLVLDAGATGNVTGFVGLGSANNGYPYVRRYGDTFVAQGQSVLLVRSLTLTQGMTLVGTLAQSGHSPGPGNGLVILAAEFITIDGTISADGLSASGRSGAGQLVNGQANFGGGGGGDGATGAGQPGQYAWNLGGAPFLGGSGGNGGHGSGATATGGAGGAASGTLLLGSPMLQGIGDDNEASGVTYWRPYNASTIMAAGGGNGGGGGGGDGQHAGGGGGQGGAIVHLIAPTITIGASAHISVNGGDGAPGSGGDSGGGGGGGAGLVAMDALVLSVSSAATLVATPGSGGANRGSGQPGAGGASSLRFQDPPVSDGGQNLGNGFLLRQWQ